MNKLFDCSMVYSDRRLADHFGGKLHLGYMQIREKLAEMQVKFLQFSLVYYVYYFLVGSVHCLYIFHR